MIKESDWTRWAREHDVELHITPIPLKLKRGSSVGGAHVFKDKFNRNYFFKNEWTEWEKNFDPNLDPFISTIQEYKDIYNRRPDWAKTFSEQYKKRDCKVLKPFDRTGENKRFWGFEEEIITNNKGIENRIVRFLDTSGNCRRVVSIGPPDEDSFCHFRQEDWISKGKWEVKKESWFPVHELKFPQDILMSHNVIDTPLK
jgi:hypothetical protein